MRRLKPLLLAGLLLCVGAHVALALTLSDVRTNVRRNVRDTASSTSLRRYSDAVLLSFINEAQRTIINETWATSDSSATTVVAGTTYYALPSDVIRVWRVTYNGANLPQLQLNQLDADNFDQDWRTGGTPTAFYFDRAVPSSIALQPWPAASGGALKVFYFKLVPDLANDSDVPFNNDARLTSYHDLIVYHVTLRLLLQENRAPEADAYRALYDAGLTLMQANLGNKPVRQVKPSTEVKP